MEFICFMCFMTLFSILITCAIYVKKNYNKCVNYIDPFTIFSLTLFIYSMIGSYSNSIFMQRYDIETMVLFYCAVLIGYICFAISYLYVLGKEFAENCSKGKVRLAALLFPTYYEGEGMPGTIIDAFSAGLPVIASDWKYNTEIVSDNTGIIFKTGNISDLVRCLIELADYPDNIIKKKPYCLKEANRYDPDKVILELFNRLEI